MQKGHFISALVASFVTLLLSSIFKHVEKVNLNRNLRLMLSREMEENRHVLSQTYKEAEKIVTVGLRPGSFRFKIWDSTMSKAPAFLSAPELNKVEVFYRNLRELQELKEYLKEPSSPKTEAVVSRMTEVAISLGSMQCIGRQRLNFFNYFFVIWNHQDNKIEDLQYHFTYPPSVVIGRNDEDISPFKRIRIKIKDAWTRIWYL